MKKLRHCHPMYMFVGIIKPIINSLHLQWSTASLWLICRIQQSFPQSLSCVSLVYLSLLHPPLRIPCIFTQSFSSGLEICPYHFHLFHCSTISSVSTLRELITRARTCLPKFIPSFSYSYSPHNSIIRISIYTHRATQINTNSTIAPTPISTLVMQ